MVIRIRVLLFLFFFKQKTAYEMRISDWSSDVCSSDLLVEGGLAAAAGVAVFAVLRMGRWRGLAPHLQVRAIACAAVAMAASQLTLLQPPVALPAGPFQLACFVAVAGAIGLSASALFAIRAAILAFPIGLSAVISWLAGPGVGAARQSVGEGK